MRALFTLTSFLAILGTGSLAQADPDAAKGQQTYTIFCATCHGPLGDGQGPVGKTLNPPPRDFTGGEFKFGGTDQDIFDVISNGAATKGGSPLMAPWGAVIPESDRWNVVAFIRTLLKGAPEVSSKE
jgi:mono/diheme cytochrome c family protein